MSLDPYLIKVASSVVKYRLPSGVRRWFFYNGRCLASAQGVEK